MLWYFPVTDPSCSVWAWKLRSRKLLWQLARKPKKKKKKTENAGMVPLEKRCCLFCSVHCQASACIWWSAVSYCEYRYSCTWLVGTPAIMNIHCWNCFAAQPWNLVFQKKKKKERKKNPEYCNLGNQMKKKMSGKNNRLILLKLRV